MSNPRKPRKNEPRETLEIILHPFYSVTVYDDNGEVEDLVPPDRGDPSAFFEELYAKSQEKDEYLDIHVEDQLDCNYETWYDLKVLAPVVQKVWEENQDKYDEIGITCSVDSDAYRSYPCIVGKRYETDAEYDARVKKLHDDYNTYVKERDKKKKAKADQKKDKIAQLKKELERLEGKK